jgi:hypothetical protein
MNEKIFNAKIEMLDCELTAVYGLLGMAHLNLKQHLEYGFNPKTAHSTLISIGKYYPRLKIEMKKTYEDEEFECIEREIKWRKFLDENPPISIPLITQEEWKALNADQDKGS